MLCLQAHILQHHQAALISERIAIVICAAQAKILACTYRPTFPQQPSNCHTFVTTTTSLRRDSPAQLPPLLEVEATEIAAVFRHATIARGAQSQLSKKNFLSLYIPPIRIHRRVRSCSSYVIIRHYYNASGEHGERAENVTRTV